MFVDFTDNKQDRNTDHNIHDDINKLLPLFYLIGLAFPISALLCDGLISLSR